MLTDERYKQLMEDVGRPNSRSLLIALKQAAQEARCDERLKTSDRILELEKMLRKKMDLIRCGIGSNYSGDPKENVLYTEAYDVLVARLT